MRGGVIFDGPSNWSFHCFNCGYGCNFMLGRSITPKTKQFLEWCGLDKEQVQRWSLESLQHRDLLDFQKAAPRSKKKFKEVPLPEGELISPTNPDHQRFIDYLATRGMKYNDYPFMVSPNGKLRQRNRIIVPYSFKNRIVGSSSRYIDNLQPKYVNDQQTGYVFGFDFQRPEWQVVILVEGIFDAISINGCAYLHETISTDQAKLLAELNKRIIVVPDQDPTGLAVCERALELGYSVSIPNWGPGVKDVNDAVVKYGKLPTLMSILQAATMSKVKIELRRNHIGRLQKKENDKN